MLLRGPPPMAAFLLSSPPRFREGGLLSKAWQPALCLWRPSRREGPRGRVEFALLGTQTALLQPALNLMALGTQLCEAP